MDTLNEHQIATTLEAFYRDGFAHVPGVVPQHKIEALKARADELLDDPALQARENPERHDRHYAQRHTSSTGEQVPFILRNTIELDPLFADMLEFEPILQLAQAAVGEGCRFCGQNVLRNISGVAIENWHVDGALQFPLPEDIPRHDVRARPPVMWLTIQIALSDIDSIEYGPTQYVPGSHFSGRHPNDQDNPTFEGQGPVSVFCKAGDIYLQDPQCWHRGAPNTSDRTRYLMQSQYAVDWAYGRFGWMNRVPVDEQHLRTASDQLLRLLGRPRPGPQATS